MQPREERGAYVRAGVLVRRGHERRDVALRGQRLQARPRLRVERRQRAWRREARDDRDVRRGRALRVGVVLGPRGLRRRVALRRLERVHGEQVHRLGGEAQVRGERAGGERGVPRGHERGEVRDEVYAGLVRVDVGEDLWYGGRLERGKGDARGQEAERGQREAVREEGNGKDVREELLEARVIIGGGRVEGGERENS